MILNLPSFGGTVTAQIETTSLEACEKVRRTIVRELGGEQNINGTVSVCHSKAIQP
jgi:hypothetical protein